MQSIKSIVLVAMLFGAALPGIALPQSFRRGGTEFNAIRTVDLGASKSFNVVVTEFLHHGEIAPDGRNVLVAAKNQLVPWRLMQLGPGDFCRIAFQTLKDEKNYEILYGGNPPSERAPPWTNQDGLILETRHFRNCNLQNLEPVRRAFDSSTAFGSDYVMNVFHGENPFSLKREPFFSKYSGYIDIASPGKYGFMTASQDASFLLIDGKVVVSAPGRHGPTRFAFRGARQDVQLSAGMHKFEYYHAATGSDGIMAAYWEPDPKDTKPKPEMIPPTVFHVDRVGHLQPAQLALRTLKPAPDFSAKMIAEAPLPENERPLVVVSFRDLSPKSLTNQGKGTWDFGDGQTGSGNNIEHVYLRPGLYTVKLSYRYGGRNLEISNRVEVERPSLDVKDKPHNIDDYLKAIESYSLLTMDAASLRQLALVYELKSTNLENRIQDLQKELDEGPADPNRKPPDEKDQTRIKKVIDNLSSQAEHYLTQAIETGKTALAESSISKTDDDSLKLATHLGPIARWRLGDSPQALKLWQAAAENIKNPAMKAECLVAAADILINDLVRAKEAKPLLDQAGSALGAGRSGAQAAEFQRVLGDYYAATGDGNAARQAYETAEQARGPGRKFIERTAWKGAHSRSAEEFIKSNEFQRAAEQLQSWQREYPTEKIDGYLTLLMARYWAARGKYGQAVAQAEQLVAVSPASPYADQILFLAADCELRRGRADRAAATLRSIAKDYPGSPLMPEIDKKVKELEKR